jgi:sarcosine oxidase subunit alpha
MSPRRYTGRAFLKGAHDLLFRLDGEPIEAQPGDTIAAALLRAGITTFTRSIKYHRPRGPFCFTGSCGQCLMRVDGVPSVQVCRAPAREGMRCERQNAPLGSADRDLLRAVDFIFPGGLDHHHIVTFSKTAGQIAMRVARSLAGLGHLPDQPLGPVPARVREASVVVVGAGPAGLAAAGAAGQGTVVVERDDTPGGAALLDLDLGGPGPSVVNELANAARDAGADLWLRSECVGLYADEGKP